MMDLIDREQTIAHLKKRAVETALNNPDSKELVDNVYFELAENRIATWINEIPSARPKGKWIPVTNGRGGFECSECHNYAPSYQDGVEWLSDFCPHCGAEMEVE